MTWRASLAGVATRDVPGHTVAPPALPAQGTPNAWTAAMNRWLVSTLLPRGKPL